MEKTYHITGLKCQGCADKVSQRLSRLKKVEAVAVNLDQAQVTVTGKASKWSLKRALKDSKYELGAEV